MIWLTLPIALYNNVYIIAGWLIHPASLPFFFPLIRFVEDIDLDAERESFFSERREVKRVSVQANDYLIDTLIVGKKETLAMAALSSFLMGMVRFMKHEEMTI